MEDSYFLYPERTDYAQALARCQLRLGLLDEAEETIEACLEAFGQTETAHLIRANIALEKKQYATALTHLETVRQQAPRDLQLLALLGTTLLRMRRWEDCIAVCHTALEVDPDNAAARLGLARCALQLGNAEEAMNHALAATGLQYGNAQGHFLLGVALNRLGHSTEAAQALRVAVKLAPRFFAAYRYLYAVLRRRDEQEAARNVLFTLWHLQSKAAQERLEHAERLRADTYRRAEDREVERHRRREEERRRRDALEASALEPDQEFVIVSGLPRSGTSLMMQMLEAGGLALMTDGLRQADEDNPEGYREWEEIRKLPKEPLIIEKAHGRVVKVVSALLPHLPPKHRYRIIFMHRPAEEVVASQWKMLDRRGVAPKSERAHLQQTQAEHAERIVEGLRRSERVKLIEVDYPALVANPADWVATVVDFLGRERLPNADAMRGCIKLELYRNRAAPAGEQAPIPL